MTNNDSLDEHFKDIERIFNSRKQNVSQEKYERALNAYERGYNNSTGKQRQERKSSKKKVNQKAIANKFVWVLVVAMLVIVFSKTISSIDESLNSPTSMTNLGASIGGIVHVVDDPWESQDISILSQNTRRNANGPYYLHDSIAKDLIKLPPELFDYALGALCYDMGSNIYNEVAQGGRTNIDGVIDYLVSYTKNPDTDNKAYIKDRLEGCKGIDDYLTKYGYVDKKGEPDLDKFIKACNENAQNVYDFYIYYTTQGKGVELN